MHLKRIYKRVLTLLLIVPLLLPKITSNVYADDAINSPDWIPVISVYDSTTSNPLRVRNYFIRSGSPFTTSYYREMTGTGHYVGYINFGSVDYVVQTCTHTTASNQSCYVSPVQHDDTFKVNIYSYTNTGIASASTFVSTPGLDRYTNGDYVVFGVSGFHYDASLISFMASSGMIPSRYFHSSNYNNSIDVSGIIDWLKKIYDELASFKATFVNAFMNQTINKLYDIAGKVDNFQWGYMESFNSYVKKFDSSIQSIIDAINNSGGGGGGSIDNTLIQNQTIIDFWNEFTTRLSGYFDTHLTNIENFLNDIKQAINDFRNDTNNIINNPKETNFWDFLTEVFTTLIDKFFDALKSFISDFFDFTQDTINLLDKAFRAIGKYLADRLTFLFIPSDSQQSEIKTKIASLKEKSGGIGQLSDSVIGYYRGFDSIAESGDVLFTWEDITIPYGTVIPGGSFNVSDAISSSGLSAVQETVKIVFTFSVVLVTIKRCLRHILKMLGVNIQI